MVCGVGINSVMGIVGDGRIGAGMRSRAFSEGGGVGIVECEKDFPERAGELAGKGIEKRVLMVCRCVR